MGHGDCPIASRLSSAWHDAPMSDLESALARVPIFADATDLTTSRLAGLTNVNHLVAVGDDRYVLRIPGEGTSEYINRVDEEVAARSAAAAGVNAEVVFFDPSDGLMVTRFVDGAATMNAELFKDLDAVARAGHAFRQLHTTAAPFAHRLHAVPDDRRVQVAAGVEGRDAARRLRRRPATGRGRARRARGRARPLAPCHCDPLCENFLDTGERMFIIDYEYAGNNDPMWDLGDLSVEGGFGDRTGRGAAARLLRRRSAGRPAWPHGCVQGVVRPVVDAVGCDPTRQRQSGRRLLGVCGRALRTLQGVDVERPTSTSRSPRSVLATSGACCGTGGPSPPPSPARRTLWRAATPRPTGASPTGPARPAVDRGRRRPAGCAGRSPPRRNPSARPRSSFRQQRTDRPRRRGRTA